LKEQILAKVKIATGKTATTDWMRVKRMRRNGSAQAARLESFAQEEFPRRDLPIASQAGL
jgi:hypothetical protein